MNWKRKYSYHMYIMLALVSAVWLWVLGVIAWTLFNA